MNKISSKKQSDTFSIEQQSIDMFYQLKQAQAGLSNFFKQIDNDALEAIKKSEQFIVKDEEKEDYKRAAEVLSLNKI